MAGTLVTILWRDIPAQVTARVGRTTEKAILAGRFQEAIDRAAQRAGRTSTDDYLAEWRREERPCGEDLRGEVDAEVRRIEGTFTRAVLDGYVATGGWAPQ